MLMKWIFTKWYKFIWFYCKILIHLVKEIKSYQICALRLFWIISKSRCKFCFTLLKFQTWIFIDQNFLDFQPGKDDSSLKEQVCWLPLFFLGLIRRFRGLVTDTCKPNVVGKMVGFRKDHSCEAALHELISLNI